MDIADRSTASTGGPSSAVRGSAEFSSPSRNVTAVSGFSKTLVVAVESLKVGEFDGDEMDSKPLLSPRSSSCTSQLFSGIRKSGAKSRHKQSEEVYECDFEEDIIDGFAIVSFGSLEDLEVWYFRLFVDCERTLQTINNEATYSSESVSFLRTFLSSSYTVVS
jgi:hypothetical protein